MTIASASSATIVVRIAIAGAIVVPCWYWSGGLLELEATQFIQQYLDGRGILQKVFDPRLNDLGAYQAREFSYFIDYLDAQVWAALLAADWLVFIPASAIVASILTVAVFMRAARSYGLPAHTSGLVLLIYSSNYVHLVSMGMFYRSAKPLLAPLVMAAVFLVLATLRDSSDSPPRLRTTALVTVLCAMSLLDRQGFFYAVLAVAVLVFRDLTEPRRLSETAAAAIGVAAMVAYDLILAPMIVLRLNGYRPTLEYQTVPIASLFDGVLVRRSIDVLLRGVSAMFAGLPGWAIVLAIGALLAYAIRPRRPPMEAATPSASWRRWRPAKVAILAAAVAFSQVVMFTIMARRHPPLYEQPDHTVWYYPLPLQAFVAALLVPLLGAVASRWSRPRWATVNVAIAILVAINVVWWANYERQQRQSHWFQFVHAQSWLLKRSFEDGRPYSLRPGYQEFYDFCLQRSAALRARAERAGSLANR
jgi:hypothetical protein